MQYNLIKSQQIKIKNKPSRQLKYCPKKKTNLWIPSICFSVNDGIRVVPLLLCSEIHCGIILAFVCYKLDRIGRKTSDLLRLLDFLEKHKVDLLICSNNINTASGVSKIFIQIFAVVAEFERDTLTERITDNMMELAKDGRWLGGNTPTGFTVKRVKTGSGKNKSAYSYLESIPEEKAMIQKLYAVFSETRSIKKTADRMNELGYRTKIGSKFNTSTTRLLLKNPVYCVADEIVYNYFYENGGGVCADLSEFDGQHGLSAYNKTDQEKFEDADSTFISPKFVQLMSAKPVSKWIISVGRHEGFIPSQQWIDTQNMLDSIAEKYNRPHRKTNALLAGLVYCPHCGKRLRVISESNRWTNNKLRFKYVCPGYRENECTFQSVDGVLLDEFVVQQLSNLSDEDSKYFTKLLNQRASDIFKNSQNEQELTELKKKKAQLETAIFNQVKNMRDASDDLKRFIQEDIQELSNELREVGILLEKLEDSKQNQMYAVRNIEEIKERLLSFGKYAKGAQPDVLITLIQSFAERIYIVEKNDERYCHIFIKGCTKEDYDEFFRATGYISGTREAGAITSKLPLCDSDECSKSYFYLLIFSMSDLYCRFCKAFPIGVDNIPTETPTIHTYFQLIKTPTRMMITIAIPQYRHWNFPFALLNSLDKSMPFDECGAFSMNSAAPFVPEQDRKSLLHSSAETR